MKLTKSCVESKALLGTKIGKFEIVFCVNGLHSVKLLTTDTDSCEQPKSDAGVNDAMFDHGTRCIQWLRVYFERCKLVNTMNKPPICALNASDCYLKIWNELANTKVGETLSYADLSERVFGHRNGSRVVGTAMRRNPCSIIVPCHRVIKSNGDSGNYCGGTRNELKKYLIDYEKSSL